MIDPQNGTQKTILKSLELFYLDVKVRNLSPRTLSYYQERLGRFATWLQGRGVESVAALDAASIKAFLRDLQEQGLRPHTVHGYARAIKTLCFFLVREELRASNPFDQVRMPKLPNELLPPFTVEDVRALLTACAESQEPTRDKALVLLLLDSGVRASELVALNVGDLDMATGALTVRKGKGSKGRVTFVGARTRQAIVRYLMTRPAVGPDAPLFAGLPDGVRLGYFGLRSLLDRLGGRAGVVDCSAHRFRRTFALEALRAGMPIMQLAAMMGHGSLTVLQKYLRLLTDDLQDAHAQHGPVNSILRK